VVQGSARSCARPWWHIKLTRTARPTLVFICTTLRWCWVFLERTRILSGIQFTTHFIDFFVVETKRSVSSFVNVILTRQTCGQRSRRAAESKRRALGNYFPDQICGMFQISKCKGDRDVCLGTTSVLAFAELQINGKIRFSLRRITFFFFESRHCAVVLQTQVPKLCTDIHLRPL